MIIGIRVRTIYERCKKMIKRNARFDTLGKRVEELFVCVNECSTQEGISLALEQRDKCIKALKVKNKYLLTIVVKLIKGEGDSREHKATQNPKKWR